MRRMPRRFDFHAVLPGGYWADAIAARLIADNPKEESFTCAAGISPSGIVHFGNFRDVITAHLVALALERRGKKARRIFSWDNFDRFRKVPVGVDESFTQHIGKPLSKVPDPEGELASYAERFQKPFVAAMQELGIELEYIDQTTMYESGAYDAGIFHALSQRKEIADILLSFMTEKAKTDQELDEAKYREEFYPISVYSRFTGKDTTKVLSYDGASIVTYLCLETEKEESVDLSKERIAKLGWKIDWAMRWKREGVRFEPGGHDHASPGGSYDAASRIAQATYTYDAPLFAEYKFIGIQGLGAKMSGSKGNAISPGELLGIYDPVILKWLYGRKSPQQSFMLAFDSEIYRQYDEFDREMAAYTGGTMGETEKLILADALGGGGEESFHNPIPFRQAVGFGQIVQWDAQKLKDALKASGLSYGDGSIASRLPRARQWLETYNPGEKIALLDTPNTAYASTLDADSRAHIAALREKISPSGGESVENLEVLVYAIPKKEGLDEKELKKAQRAFFAHVYNLLIGKDTGPRLGTFLWAVDRKRVLDLLTIA
jgi:lysyl-tRNA synthetase, class I